MRKVTTDRAISLQDLDICVISANLAQQSARMAKAGDYEEALQNARRVKVMIEGQVKTAEQKRLFDIFMSEYKQINAALESAISAEGGNADARSAGARSEHRTDFVAQRLYSHKAAKSEACLVM